MPLKIILLGSRDTVQVAFGSPEHTKELIIAGEADYVEQAIELYRHVEADLVIVELNKPVDSGIRSIQALKRLVPGIRLLALVMHDFDEQLIDLLGAGATGYVLKNSGAEELEYAMSRVAGGKIYIGAELALSMLDRLKAAHNASENKTPGLGLSEGERLVLELMAEGYTNTQMANKLFTSVRTIESRRKKLLDKTGTTNTATLMKFAVMNGLVK